MIGGFFAAIVAVFTSLLSGCGDDGLMSRFMLKPDRIIVERRPDPVYDRLFPYYVELCAEAIAGSGHFRGAFLIQRRQQPVL